jgi:hypothetical protein
MFNTIKGLEMWIVEMVTVSGPARGPELIVTEPIFTGDFKKMKP